MKSKKLHIFIFFSFTFSALSVTILQGQQLLFHQDKLSQAELNSQVDLLTREEFHNNFSNIIAYNYSDNHGNFLFMLVSNKGPYLLEDKDSAVSRIEIINYRRDGLGLKKVKTFSDEALPDFVIGVKSISFLENYIYFNDLDGDSIVDPLVVYTSQTKTSMVLFYKGSEITIENVFKGYEQKSLSISEKFYALPLIIQEKVKGIMLNIDLEFHEHFPKKWFAAMGNRKLLITENVRTK